MRNHGLHHIHLRKRIHQQYQPYPHPNKWIHLLYKSLIFLAVIGPLTTFPQLYDIFWKKNVLGLSFWTWFSYTLLSLPWLIYGLVHKDKPIFISSLLWFMIQGVVAWGIYLYS